MLRLGVDRRNQCQIYINALIVGRDDRSHNHRVCHSARNGSQTGNWGRFSRTWCRGSCGSGVA